MDTTIRNLAEDLGYQISNEDIKAIASQHREAFESDHRHWKINAIKAYFGDL